jgi:uncharacterized protein YbjT (DUF2867 family)
MILVTGASGTLGKEISRQLTQEKRDFRCLVRKTSQIKELEEMGASLSYGDVTDKESLRKAMQGVTHVISTHCLGMPKKGLSCWDVDYQGNLNLIELFKENGGGKIVYISAIGSALHSPFQLHKVKRLVDNALTVSGLDYTILRPSGFFSDFTMSAKVVQKYHLYPSMGRGDHKVQGIHVGDLAYCAINALDNSKASHQAFYIGGPEVLTYTQIAATFAKVLGHNVRVFPIPMGFIKFVGWIVDTFTSYRYQIQGFAKSFSKESVCDNGPLLKTFDIKLKTFEEYLRDYFAK